MENERTELSPNKTGSRKEIFLNILENNIIIMVPTCGWIQHGTSVIQHSDRK